MTGCKNIQKKGVDLVVTVASHPPVRVPWGSEATVVPPRSPLKDAKPLVSTATLPLLRDLPEGARA
eukprot:1177026-Prorocentrum_minimum.AAC.1